MKISVILPTFNSEKFVGYAIRAIIDYVDEIVVVDMSSTDNTFPIINYIGSSKMSFVLLKDLLKKGEKQNLDRSIECGLKLATGDVIMRVDDDWVWGEGVKDLRKYCEQGINEKKKGAFYSTYNLITCSEYFLPIRSNPNIIFRCEETNRSLVSFGSYKTDNNIICHFDEIKRSSGRRFVKQRRSKYVETPLRLGHWKFLKDTPEAFIHKWTLFTGCSRAEASQKWLFYHKKSRVLCPKDLLEPLYVFRKDLIRLGGFNIIG